MSKVHPIEVGTSVKLKGQSSIGEVLEINGKNATVMFGMIKTTVKIDRLERSNISPSAAQKSTAKSTFVSSETQDRVYD